MNCPKCGNEMNPNTQFCAKCGTPAKKVETNKEYAQPLPSSAAPQPVKNKNGKKKNTALKIIAAVLALVVFLTGGLFAVDAILFKNETEKDGYITDFPVLKQQTDLLVYDEEKFPYEDYNIKVDRFKTGKVFKSSTFGGLENIINERSGNPVYNIDFKEDGKYQITLEGIVSSRTQAAPSTTVPSSSPETTTAAKQEEAVVIVIIVIVDNDSNEAVDKVTINSKPGDKPIESLTPTIGNVEKDVALDKEKLADLEDMMLNIMPYGLVEFDSQTTTTYQLVNRAISAFDQVPAYDYFFNDAVSENADKKADPLKNWAETPYIQDGIKYWVLKEENVEWICENIFNVNYNSDYSDMYKYSYGGYVYLVIPNEKSEVEFDGFEIVSTKEENGKYVFVVKSSSTKSNISETYEVIAELKDVDGEEKWSLHKIANTEKVKAPTKEEFVSEYWGNTIQCRGLFKFLENGKRQQISIGELARMVPKNISSSSEYDYEEVTYTYENGVLHIYGDVWDVELEWVSYKDHNIVWDVGIDGHFKNEEGFFYQTGWKASIGPSDNATYYVKEEFDTTIPEDAICEHDRVVTIGTLVERADSEGNTIWVLQLDEPITTELYSNDKRYNGDRKTVKEIQLELFEGEETIRDDYLNKRIKVDGSAVYDFWKGKPTTFFALEYVEYEVLE